MKKFIVSSLVALTLVFSASAKNIINLGLNFGGDYTTYTQSTTQSTLGGLKTTTTKTSVTTDAFKSGIFLGYDYALEMFDGWGPHFGFLVNAGIQTISLKSATTVNDVRDEAFNINQTTACGYAAIAPEVGLSYYAKNLFQISYIPIYYDVYDFSYNYTISNSSYKADVKTKNYRWGFRGSLQFGESKCRNGFNFQLLFPYNFVWTTETKNSTDTFNSRNLPAFTNFEFSIGYKMSFVF